MIVISQQRNGPPTSANGGLAAGRFVELVDPCRASVRFHRPVPMAAELRAQADIDHQVISGPVGRQGRKAEESAA